MPPLAERSAQNIDLDLDSERSTLSRAYKRKIRNFTDRKHSRSDSKVYLAEEKSYRNISLKDIKKNAEPRIYVHPKPKYTQTIKIYKEIAIQTGEDTEYQDF